MYVDCSYQTNVYGSFHTHKWRKHKVCTVRDLKPGIVHGSLFSSSAFDSVNSDIDLNEDVIFQEPTFVEPKDLIEDVELKLASVGLSGMVRYLKNTSFSQMSVQFQ